ITWTVYTDILPLWLSVATDGERLVFAGYTSSAFHGISTDGGVTVSLQANFSTTRLTSVAYGDSQFVMVGREGFIQTSPDGLIWTTQTSGVADNLNAIGFCPEDGTWIAAGVDILLK